MFGLDAATADKSCSRSSFGTSACSSKLDTWRVNDVNQRAALFKTMLRARGASAKVLLPQGLCLRSQTRCGWLWQKGGHLFQSLISSLGLVCNHHWSLHLRAAQCEGLRAHGSVEARVNIAGDTEPTAAVRNDHPLPPRWIKTFIGQGQVKSCFVRRGKESSPSVFP